MDQSDIIRPERGAPMLGVPGRFFTLRRPPAPWKPGTFANQTWISESRSISGYGSGATLTVEARFDGRCRNGHNTFSMTAEVRRPGARDVEACGCLHDDIAQVFPELAPLIPWHLTSTDGPMHYASNAVYLAGDRDCWGLRKGERRPIIGRDGSMQWELVAVNAPGVRISGTPTGQKYADQDELPLFILEKHAAGAEPPAAPRLEWRQSCRIGEGKARELDAARRVAVWPDATDAELCAEPDELRAALMARLPALLERFRADMERAGFVWQCE